MFLNLFQNRESAPIKQKAGSFLLHRVEGYTKSFRQELDSHIDKRLVDTFFDLFVIILMFRNRSMGLLLSELGGFILGFHRAPAGTKRISNLLRSNKWAASLIDRHLFDNAVKRIGAILEQGKRPLLLWDDSRIEKHESWRVEGLCSVLSSKAKRLTRIRRGFFTPPSTRICVPGMKWTGVFLSHLGGIPSVCQMSWWTTRGKFKEDPDNIIWRLLRRLKEQLPKPLVHVLDRGYASEKMLRYFLHFEQDIIVRWKKNHLLGHEVKGCKKTHLLARSFRDQATRIVQDKVRKNVKKIGIAWAKVSHPEFPDTQFFLVIVRDKKNYNGPMYILTTIPIKNHQQAWEIMFSYIHRWEAEQGFRFLKSEMALESPRLWFWNNRLKLMAIVTLVYDFLLKTLRNWRVWVGIFLRHWGHRTGERYRDASIPLYRLRAAISICLTVMWAQNSG